MPSAHHNNSAATDPHVPGPGLPSPAPKKVPAIHAQRVFIPGIYSSSREFLSAEDGKSSSTSGSRMGEEIL